MSACCRLNVMQKDPGDDMMGAKLTLSRLLWRSVILRSEAEPALSEAEGKNLVFDKQVFCCAKNEILRPRYASARNGHTSAWG